MGFGSSFDFSGFGEGGGEGGRFGCCDDVSGAGDPFGVADSDALRKFSSPLRLGTKKLYAIGAGAGGGCPKR